MEEGTDTYIRSIKRIAITGPECTGKSTLAEQLAGFYGTVFVPEYARSYIEGLHRPYHYEDVVKIAEMQKKQHDELPSQGHSIVFMDTYLIITKIWFDVVYGRCPEWISEEIATGTIDLYLLCNTDIPWEEDPVRENGGEMRERLFAMYQSELKQNNLNHSIVSGTGKQRYENALSAVNAILT